MKSEAKLVLITTELVLISRCVQKPHQLRTRPLQGNRQQNPTHWIQIRDFPSAPGSLGSCFRDGDPEGQWCWHAAFWPSFPLTFSWTSHVTHLFWHSKIKSATRSISRLTSFSWKFRGEKRKEGRCEEEGKKGRVGETGKDGEHCKCLPWHLYFIPMSLMDPVWILALMNIRPDVNPREGETWALRWWRPLCSGQVMSLPPQAPCCVENNTAVDMIHNCKNWLNKQNIPFLSPRS